MNSGWKNYSCTEECSFGEYGENCQYQCTDRRCYGRQTCDPESGVCVDGCIDGWNGISCTEAKFLKKENSNLVGLRVSLGIFITFFLISGLIIARLVIRKQSHVVKPELTELKEVKKENSDTDHVPTAYEEVSDKNSSAEHQYQNVKQSEKCTEHETNTYEKLENDVVDEPSPYDAINMS